MYSFDILMLVLVLAFCIGGVLGAVFSRSILPAKQQKSLEQELEQSRDELKQYQQDVAEHFMSSSAMLNKISSQYQAMHEHVAKGAIALTSSDVSQQIIDAASGQAARLEEKGEILDESDLNQPKDWAPKRPGEAGTLSEEYGISRPKAAHDDPIEVISARAPMTKHPH